MHRMSRLALIATVPWLGQASAGGSSACESSSRFALADVAGTDTGSVGLANLACTDSDVFALENLACAHSILFALSNLACEESASFALDVRACAPESPLACDDGNPCTDDLCDVLLGCQHADNLVPCEDGLFCTVDDECAAGACGGSPRDCGAVGDQCNAGVCNEVTDTCDPQAVADGSPCDDNDACTVADVCSSGTCGGTRIVELYGDLAPPGGDGSVNLDDLLCVLNGFASFEACPPGDIAPCFGDGIIDLDDMLAVLSAFSGNYRCPHPCAP